MPTAKAPRLTVVTPTFKLKQKQVTKFLVVDPGLSYVAFLQVITIAHAKQIQQDFSNSPEEYKVKVVPYVPAMRKMLLANPQLASTINSYTL